MRILAFITALLFSVGAIAQPLPPPPAVGTPGNIASFLQGGGVGDSGVLLRALTAHDEIIGTDGVIAAGSTAFYSPSATFTGADVGKTIILDGLGVGGVDLQTTIAAYVDAHDVTLATPTTYAGPWWGIGRATVPLTATVTASYSIGDYVYPSGGTYSTQGAFQVVSLGAATPTVALGGSGGANGTCKVMGTTGVTRTNWSGNPIAATNTTTNGFFELQGTVSGGSLTGPLTVIQPGDYTTAPTNLTAEPVIPVSGTCSGLTGATVNLYMAPHYLQQTTAGHYTALPSNPVATTTSGTGAGATLTLYGQTIAGSSAPGDLIGGLWAYGTDDTASINAAIAQAMTSGGGTVSLPTGRSLMLGAMQIPYTGTAPPRQSPLRITGAGQMAPQSISGLYISMYSQGTAGSILDMRYSGTGSQVAKIDTRGMGVIHLDHISMVDYGTDNFLMFQTTNTQPIIDHVTWVGNPTCFQMSCQQNAIRLGGITTAAQTLSTNAATDGYQNNTPTVMNSFFGQIQEAVQFGGSANSGFITNNQIDRTSGSWISAPFHFYGVAGGAGSNMFYGNEVEMSGYQYGVKMDSINSYNNGNTFNGGPSFFDGSGLTAGMAGVPTVSAFYFDANSIYNTINGVFAENDIKQNMVTQVSPLNTIISGSQGAPTVFPLPVQLQGGLSINTTAVTNGLLYGPGTGTQTFVLNGGNSGNNGGAAIQFQNGGSACGFLGGKSAIMGGGYSSDLDINSNCGDVHISNFNTDAIQFDYTNGINVLTDIRFSSYTKSSPASGATVTIEAKQHGAIVTPAGSLAALTIALPACTSALDGDEEPIKITQAVTALTWSASSGSVGSDFPTSAAAGFYFVAKCQGSTTTWY